MRANLAECLTTRGAKSILARVWKAQLESLKLVELGAYTNDSETAEAMAAIATATLAMFDAPIFDDVPIVAAGFRQNAGADSPTWIGHPTQIEAAGAALTDRGLTVIRSGESAHVLRGTRSVATLVEDKSHPPAPNEQAMPLRQPPRALLRIAIGLVVIGVVAGAMTRPIWMVPFVVAAIVAWLSHRFVLARQARQRRVAKLERLSTQTNGSPYRGGTNREEVDFPSALDCMRNAGLEPQRHRNTIRAIAQGAEVELCGFHGSTGRIETLELRYTDPVAAVIVGHALVGLTGPIAITLGIDRIEMLTADGFPAWQVQYDRDRATIAALVAAWDAGRDAAIGTL